MNRCMYRAYGAFLLALAPLAFSSLPSVVHAQTMQREAPRDVILGHLTVTTPPAIAIDDKPDRLSPGARIRDTQNMLVLSGTLAGKTVPVVYRRDSAGLVHEVWLLTQDEYAKLSGAGATGGQRFSELLAAIFGTRR
jgi:hypothetical protein